METLERMEGYEKKKGVEWKGREVGKRTRREGGGKGKREKKGRRGKKGRKVIKEGREEEKCS